MRVNVLSGSILETNNYILQDGNDCILVDCSANMESFDYMLQQKEVHAILLTHAHWDHYLTLEKMAKKYEVPIYMTKEAFEKLESKDNKNKVNFNKLNVKFVEDNDTLNIAGFKIKVIRTPGHTNCSVSYLIDNLLFCGDTLFLDAVGRTDLPTGSSSDLMKSLQKLFTLENETIVYPGHGPQTTIGDEKLHF